LISLGHLAASVAVVVSPGALSLSISLKKCGLFVQLGLYLNLKNRNDILVKTLEELIVKHPFVSAFDPRYFHLLQQCATTKKFEAGQSIFKEGQQAEHFFLVQAGQVRLDAFVPGRGTTPVLTVSAGGALGWSWLFPPYQWHFSAHANKATELIAFDAQFLRDKSEADHDFGYELIKRVSQVLLQRLQETRLLLVDFYGFPS
jgi:CRP/FNR family cyclic AMP-dependent transcriptional regulator